MSYRLILQSFLIGRDLAAGKPAPTCQATTRSMVHAEVVSIANTRNPSNETSAPQEARTDVDGLGYSAKVALVKPVEPK